MAHTLRISDGTTTIDFLGTNYKILTGSGWRPRRAQRNQSMLGYAYSPVVETMAIQVSGSSESDCLDKLQDLSDLLEQAHVYGLRGNVTRTYLEYEPAGSALAASVKASIIGPPPDADFITMPASFPRAYTDEAGNTIGWVNDPIILSFVREGLWYGTTEAKSAAQSTGNPAIMTPAAFTEDFGYMVPYDLYVDFNSADAVEGASTHDIYFVGTNSANKLVILEAESGDTLTNVTNTAVTTASNDAVGKITASSSWSIQYNAVNFSSFDSESRVLTVWAVMQNLATNDDVTIKAEWILETSAGLPTVSSVTRTVEDSASWQVINFGNVPIRQSMSNYILKFSGASGASTSGTDPYIDYFIIAAMDASTNIVRCRGYEINTTFDRLTIDQNLLTSEPPWFYTDNQGSGVKVPLSYDGNINMTTDGNSISVCVFGIGGLPDTSIISDAANPPASDELNMTLTVTRQKAYLTPL